MKLIIEIDKEKYEWIKENNPHADPNSIVGAVAYGVPLPKGYEDLIDKEQFEKMRLIDADRLTDKLVGLNDYRKVCEIINNSPTISDRYDEGYAQGYVDGSTGADWRGEE